MSLNYQTWNPGYETNYGGQYPMQSMPNQNWYMSQASVQVPRAKGKEAVKQYPLPPLSSMLFADEDEPIVWLKRTDRFGESETCGYYITPIESKPDPEDRIRELEERIAMLERSNENGQRKPDNGYSGKRQQRMQATANATEVANQPVQNPAASSDQ